MKKNTTILILFIVVLVLGVVYFKMQYKKAQVTGEAPIESLDQATNQNTTADINSSLESIDLELNAEEDLQLLDQDIEQL